jgi:hypothetical protein
LVTNDARCSACLAEILTGKSCGDDIDIWKCPKFSHVWFDFDIELMPKYGRSARVDFANHLGVEPRSRQPELYASDPCE